MFIKTYQTDTCRLYYRGVIKFLSSRSKWRFTRNISRKYYTCFVTFSFPIWSSLTSSVLSHNRCYGQLNDSSNSVPLHPFMTYRDSGLSKEWEIDNKKLRHIYNGKIELNAVSVVQTHMHDFKIERAHTVHFDLKSQVTTRNREI